MDYCYQCRRTLNGALVCPGCGAYAPDIAPPSAAYRGDAGPAAAPWESAGHPPLDLYRAEPYSTGMHAAQPHRDPAGAHAAAQAAASLFDSPQSTAGTDGAGGLGDTAGPGGDFAFDEGPATDSVLGPASIAPTLHRGRAARRRQMERWKKNRRRAAAATAVALFGGGVTVASMSHSGKGSPTAASAGNPEVPTSLHTDTASSQRTTDGNAAPDTAKSGTPNAGSTGRQPDVRTTHPSTDSVASVPRTVIPSSRPVSYTVTTRPGPSTTGAPAPTTTTAPSAPTHYTSGSVAPTSGTGSTAATPPSQQPAPPASSTPSTPPPKQLCLLIICLG